MRKLPILALILLIAVAGVACRKQQTPTVAPTATTPKAPAPTPTNTVVSATATPTPAVYVVKAGDSLSGIAMQFDVTVDELAAANGIADPNVLAVGQELVIPGPTSAPTATVAPTGTPTPDIPPQLAILDVIGRGAPAAETVVIANEGRGIDLYQWTLRDGQGNVYLFPELYLGPGAEVRVHTGVGEDSPGHLYWNRDTPVWDDPADTVILADTEGVVHANKTLD
jgi:LysM repeat protein